MQAAAAVLQLQLEQQLCQATMEDMDLGTVALARGGHQPYKQCQAAKHQATIGDMVLGNGALAIGGYQPYS